MPKISRSVSLDFPIMEIVHFEGGALHCALTFLTIHSNAMAVAKNGRFRFETGFDDFEQTLGNSVVGVPGSVIALSFLKVAFEKAQAGFGKHTYCTSAPIKDIADSYLSIIRHEI